MRSKTAYLCLALALLLSLMACKGQADEQDSQPPVTPTVAPTQEPTPTPTPPIPYTDVSEDADYYNAVVWAYKNGIASDGTTFEPDSACTRGQVITFLWRAMGSPEPQITECPISDVAPSDWFYTPVLWAYEIGISTSSTFNPGNLCSNAEVLTFLWRAEGKPAAAVHNSPVALAASGAYYERPAAWAETNGMLGSGFDPSAPCFRANLMMYLHWLTEEWTFDEEDKALQAEYEQIINDAKLYEVHGSGLVYADYVDVEGDGTVELLTLSLSGNNVTATIYANVNNGIETYCEQTFNSFEGALYLCTYDNRVCFRHENTISMMGTYDVFYKFENGTFPVSDDIYQGWGNYTVGSNTASEAEYNAVKGKYTNQKELFYYDSSYTSVKDRGLLPSENEYWINYWEAVNPSYAAVLKGDFSAFAGTYKPADGWGGDTITMDKSGTFTGGEVTSRKPISITVNENGTISCIIKSEDEDWGSNETYEEYYTIYPVGVEFEFYSFDDDKTISTDKSKVRLIYTWMYASHPGEMHYQKTP